MTNRDRNKFSQPLPKSFEYSNEVNNQNMTEEFGAETDVNEVRKQNQKSQMNKTNTSGTAGSFENQSK